VHAAVNIALFPPLFFFSALFYTDPLSTLSVLLCFLAFYIPSTHNVKRTIALVGTGAVSLLFRQTNIFWAAIFLAGFELIERLHPIATAKVAIENENNWKSALQLSWKDSKLYNPMVSAAYFTGLLIPTHILFLR
jgi:alpha-1,2-glucosyltransferase